MSLRDVVREACRRFPERLAFVGARGQATFAEVGERVRRLAQVFDSLGVGPDDTVGFVLSRRPELLYDIRLATYEHGAGLFGIAPTLPEADLARLLRSVRPRLVVYDADALPQVPALLAGVLPGVRALSAAGPSGDYEGLLSKVEDRESTHPIRPDALAALGFTSGTTGAPKGVTATQGALEMSARMFSGVLNRTGADRATGFFNPMPLFAAGGGMIVPALEAGMTMHVPDRFDAAEGLALMGRHGIGVTFLTPSMLIDLLDEDLEAADLSALKLVIYGSAPTPAVRVEEAVRRLGPVLLHGYGMAECLPPVAVLWPEEHGTREHPADRSVLRSAGRPFAGVGVRIEAEDGTVVKNGGVGEIVIDSPTVTRGYWNDPDRTARALKAGWWHSGDLGTIDAGGRVHVLDRKPDVLRRGGRTISARLVEEAGSEHPSVKEICVVEEPGTGRIVAAVSLKRSARSGGTNGIRGEIRSFLAGRLDPEAVPDKVRIFTELPRSVQGKVLKREVRSVLGQPPAR